MVGKLLSEFGEFRVGDRLILTCDGRAGLSTGDVILEVNRQRVRSLDEAVAELRRIPPGSTVFVLVARDGRRTFLMPTRQTGSDGSQ